MAMKYSRVTFLVLCAVTPVVVIIVVPTAVVAVPLGVVGNSAQRKHQHLDFDTDKDFFFLYRCLTSSYKETS